MRRKDADETFTRDGILFVSVQHRIDSVDGRETGLLRSIKLLFKAGARVENPDELLVRKPVEVIVAPHAQLAMMSNVS